MVQEKFRLRLLIVMVSFLHCIVSLRCVSCEAFINLWLSWLRNDHIAACSVTGTKLSGMGWVIWTCFKNVHFNIKTLLKARKLFVAICCAFGCHFDYSTLFSNRGTTVCIFMWLVQKMWLSLFLVMWNAWSPNTLRSLLRRERWAHLSLRLLKVL